MAKGVRDTVQILAVIDAETIMERYPNPSKDENRPTGLSRDDLQKTIYMVTRHSDVISGQASWELNVGADRGDYLNWRAGSLSLDNFLDVDLYKFNAISGGNLIRDPQLQNGRFGRYWESRVEDFGEVVYNWNFKISEDGEVKGCFYWDPQITIEKW